jgi:hypothetical protein
MATLPYIDFPAISATAKAAIQSYGTPVEFLEVGQTSGRVVKAVIYKDQTSAILLQDADSSPALALLDPDDFPTRGPQKFDIIKCAVGGFAGIWTLTADAHPILAADTLPLYIVELRRN